MLDGAEKCALRDFRRLEVALRWNAGPPIVLIGCDDFRGMGRRRRGVVGKTERRGNECQPKDLEMNEGGGGGGEQAGEERERKG